MKELIDALTRAANAFAAHYEGEPTQQTRPVNELDRRAAEVAPEKPLSEDVPAKEKKTRKSKEEKAEAAAPAGGMTEEESAKAVTDIAKLLVSKFNKVIEGKPEGFHIAKKLLLEDFKVGRLSDLSHDQRVQFVTQVKGILVNGAETKELAGVGL